MSLTCTCTIVLHAWMLTHACTLYYVGNSDYRSISSHSLSFSSGVTAGNMSCITVYISNDNKIENDEYFTLRLYGGRNVQVIEDSVMIVILDDDGKWIDRRSF